MADYFTKEPDRIYVTKEDKKIIEKLDTTNYFGLRLQDTTRSDLFLFAMALGVETHTREKLTNSDGLTLSKSLTPELKAIFFALYVKEVAGKENLDKIADQASVFNYAEEYANVGFNIIEDYQKNHKDTDLSWIIMKELDEQYEKNVKPFLSE